MSYSHFGKSVFSDMEPFEINLFGNTSYREQVTSEMGHMGLKLTTKYILQIKKIPDICSKYLSENNDLKLKISYKSFAALSNDLNRFSKKKDILSFTKSLSRLPFFNILYRLAGIRNIIRFVKFGACLDKRGAGVHAKIEHFCAYINIC